MLKIGTCVYFENVNTIEEQLRNLKANGFDNCQLLSWTPAVWTDENAALLNRLREELGLTFSAFWCGWEGPKVWDLYEGPLTLGLVPPDYRVLRIKNLCDGADFAHKLGIVDVVTHMGFIPESPHDPLFAGFCIAVRQVAEHLKANGQYLLFETGQETPVAMLRCFETVGTGNLGVNLDTANLILYGKANPADALLVFGDYVRGLHAKDGKYPTNGHDLGTETRIGDGAVDFQLVFKRLREHHYDGYVTIEREISGEQQRQDVEYARHYLQAVINDTYGG